MCIQILTMNRYSKLFGDTRQCYVNNEYLKKNYVMGLLVNCCQYVTLVPISCFVFLRVLNSNPDHYHLVACATSHALIITCTCTLFKQLVDVFGHKSNVSLVFDFMNTDLEVSLIAISELLLEY